MLEKNSVIYFDLGGVTFRDIFSGGDKSFIKYLGITKNKFLDAYIKTDDPKYSLGHLTDEERWGMFINYIGSESSKIEELIQLYFDSYIPVDQTIKLLKKIKNDFPNIELGILSDQPLSVAKLLKKKYQSIFSLFNEDYVIISSEIGLSKRDPEKKIFKYALKKAQSLSSLFIDDSMTHLANAKKVGLRGYYFDINNQSPNKLVNNFINQYLTIDN